MPNELLIFGLYEQACVGNGSGAASLWTHPADERLGATRLPYWTTTAAELERVGFDLLFFGDVLGLYDTLGGSADAALQGGVEVPALDPLVVVSALAATTEWLGLGLTVSTTYEHPFAHARRFSTLDHLSEGRIAWNIVTSYLESAARNFGLPTSVPHDARYDRADEFLDVAYALWEGSWQDDAVRADRAAGVYADPARVRTIDHAGVHFQVSGPALVDPTPQRTPLLIQAGWSPRGRAFAARHAEVVFAGESDPRRVRDGIADIRTRAAALGRDPEGIRVLVGLNPIVAPTAVGVQDLVDSLQSHYSARAQLAAYAGWGGLDLDRYADDEPIAKQQTTATETQETRESSPVITAGEVRRRFERVTVFADDRFVGTPDQVAASIERFVEESGVDGFLIHQYLSPRSLADFVELVVPRLRDRGLFVKRPRSGTLRSRFRRDGADRLAADHPAAAYRR